MAAVARSPAQQLGQPILSWPLPDFVLRLQADQLMDSFAPTLNATAHRPDACNACVAVAIADHTRRPRRRPRTPWSTRATRTSTSPVHRAVPWVNWVVLTARWQGRTASCLLRVRLADRFGTLMLARHNDSLRRVRCFEHMHLVRHEEEATVMRSVIRTLYRAAVQTATVRK